MGGKRESNEGIQIGDIFRFYGTAFYAPVGSERARYYQVVALKGKTQVVLHAIRAETHRIREGIEPGHPDYWQNIQVRPVPGQFLSEDDKEVTYGVRLERDGKEVQFHRAEVTAWVAHRDKDNHFALQEVGWEKGIVYWQERPEDWDSWEMEGTEDTSCPDSPT